MCICGSITRRTSTKHVSSDRLHCFALKRSFVCTLSNGMLYFFSTDGDMRVILCRRNASQLLKLLGKKPEGGGKKKKKERTHNHHLHIQDIVNVKKSSVHVSADVYIPRCSPSYRFRRSTLPRVYSLVLRFRIMNRFELVTPIPLTGKV